jgi:hypothetical protein
MRIRVASIFRPNRANMMPGILFRLVFLLIGSGICGVQPVLAQQIRGLVLESETLEPVPGATVTLLDGAMVRRTSAAADSAGVFRFDVAPGTYLLQAEAEGRFSPVSAPVTPGDAQADSVVLVLPSMLLGLSGTCTTLYETTTVLAGIVYDRQTGVALPGARVSALWADGPAATPTSTADDAGRYRFCGVPVDRPIQLRLSALGRTAELTVDVPAVQLARADLGVDLGIGGSTLRIIATRPLPSDTAGPALTGRIIETEGRTAVAGVVVRVAGQNATSVSADDGTFELGGFGAGEVVLEVEHLAFGTHREVVAVQRGTGVEVELLLAARPLALGAIEVLGRSAALPAARASATRFDAFMGSVLAQAQSRGERVVELVRTLPGVTVMEGRFTTRHGLASGVCLTTSRRMGTLRASPAGSNDAPWCEPIPVYVDDVPVGDAVDFLRSLNVADYESIQLLHPTDAHIRYGLAAGAAGGALVLWTRGRGPYVSQERNHDQR